MASSNALKPRAKQVKAKQAAAASSDGEDDGDGDDDGMDDGTVAAAKFLHPQEA